MNIRLMGAELFRAGGLTDRHTDMTKLTVAVHNFANAPKIYVNILNVNEGVYVTVDQL
jgi:hypothetical protein